MLKDNKNLWKSHEKSKKNIVINAFLAFFFPYLVEKA